MSTTKSIARLKALCGHSFTYQKKEVLLLDWSISGDHVTLETDGEPIKLHIAHVPEFLTELTPENNASADALNGVEKAREQHLPAVAAIDIAAMVPTSMLGSINTVLLDSITKIQNDPTYIAQAKAINETVQTAVNVAKLQVEGAKLVAAAQRGTR